MTEFKKGDMIYRSDNDPTWGMYLRPFSPTKVISKGECLNYRWHRCKYCSGYYYITEDGVTRCGMLLAKYEPLKYKLTTRKFRIYE